MIYSITKEMDWKVGVPSRVRAIPAQGTVRGTGVNEVTRTYGTLQGAGAGPQHLCSLVVKKRGWVEERSSFQYLKEFGGLRTLKPGYQDSYVNRRTHKGKKEEPLARVGQVRRNAWAYLRCPREQRGYPY